MKDSKNVLKKYASEASKYLNLKDGEEVQVKYLFVEIVPNHFDSGKKECVRYHLEFNGVEKLLESSSGKLADQMSALSEGDMISIKRAGVGNNTKYIVTKIKE